MDFLFLIDRLIPNGVTTQFCLFAKAIRKLQPDARIAVVTRRLRNRSFLNGADPAIEFFFLENIVGRKVSGAEAARKLFEFIRILRPRKIHLLDLDLGGQVYLRFGSILFSSGVCLYANAFFSQWLGPGGETRSLPVKILPRCGPFIDTVFCDNRAMTLELRKIIGPRKARTLYNPVHGSFSRPRGSSRGQILWASRISLQKKVHLLFQIATLMPHLRFHVYGVKQWHLYARQFEADLKNCPNVMYRGEFREFRDLPAGEFGAFLYTSAWDGLPNVLLEAGAAGLPIVAPAVGGIPELINSRTGYLVRDVAGYIDALDRITSHKTDWARKVEALQSKLKSRHSPMAFEKALLNHPTYLKGPVSGEDFGATRRSTLRRRLRSRPIL